MDKSSTTCNIFLILGMVTLCTFPAAIQAAVYKCKSSGGETVYSDSPCNSSSTQTLTDIRPDTITNEQPSDKKQSAVMRQLDEAVKAAIAAGDFNRASNLAVNNEQRQWVAAARKDAGKAGAALTEPEKTAEKSESTECEQAKSSLEKEANSSFHKADVLSAKKSLMLAACGLKEDPDNEYARTYVNQNVPFLFDTHRRHSRKNLDRWPHNPRPPHPPPYTSPPYDRHMEKPFGNSYIRPEEPRK